MAGWRKLGIIAGGGELPVVLADNCAAEKRPYFVARVSPYADRALERHPGVTNDLGAMGARIEAMRSAGCDAVVLLGAMLPALLAAAPQGDDALLRALLTEHERAGFRVLGAEEVMSDLLAKPGAWGAHTPTAAHARDMRLAARVAAAVGAFDVGQGVVACDGLVLAVEAQEGTDAMLRRVAELPAAVRGAPDARRGVLVKRPKPIQERRIDLPVIGVRTIETAAAAGLAGVAVEAGGALAVRLADLVAAADAAGLFVYGFTAAEVADT
jgi:DUF1009 family protein